MGRMKKYVMPDANSVGMQEEKYVERTTGPKAFLKSAESGAALGRTQAAHKKPHFAKMGMQGQIKVPHSSIKPKGAF